MKKAMALILASIMLSGILPSCSETANTDAATETTTETAVTAQETTETSESGRASVKDNLPDDLDFGGTEVAVLYRGGMDSDEINCELTGDVVADAVYTRNLAICERLNITYDFIMSDNTSTAQDLPSAAKNSILAGSDDYDIISWAQYVLLPLSIQKMFTNLKDAEYLDLEQPWWNSEYMEILSIGNESFFFLMGDISLTALKGTSAAFFNKNLFNDYIGSPDDFYSDILDGKWTVDLCKQYAELVYTDLNGDNTVDDGDLYGLSGTTIANTEHYAFACGIEFSKRDDDGMPYFTLNSDRTVKIVEKIYDLYYNTTGMLVLRDDSAFLSDSLTQKFAANQLLIMPIWMQTSDLLRDMDADYGIIPYPKLDEQQEEYGALVHDTASIFCVPITCDQTDAVCAVLEAMCAENYRTVIPAYYEVALKTKYVRDSVSAQMIDMIHNAATTDFVYAYNYALNSMGTIMRTIINDKKPDFASVYASKEAAAQTNLKDLIDTYLGNT